MLVHWQQSSSQTTIRCHHCHSQTVPRRKLTTQCSKCNRSFHLSCIKMSKYQADSLPGWFCNTCDLIINPPHSCSRTSTSNTHPHDSPSFDALIQSLISCNHLIPKGARPSFTSGLSKLINKAISSNALLDWQRLLCFPLSILSSGPKPKGISLTSSIKSRINTHLESDSLWSLSQTRNLTTEQCPQGPSHKYEQSGEPKTVRLQHQRCLTNTVRW